MAAKSTRTVGDLCDAMESIAPARAAAEWDNVGLLAGHRDWPARLVLLTIDLTAEVLDEAIRSKADVIVAYHPPLFRPVKRMLADRGSQAGLAAEALASRIALYSPHTSLDAAPGGTNETLAQLAGLGSLRPFTPAGGISQCKLIVFTPRDHVERVASALFTAGAGRIGDYEQCSYRLDGEGTFFGTDTTSPVVGAKGRLERVPETRLEVVFPSHRINNVVAATRESHPYEEPAFDIYPLESIAPAGQGQGRIGTFKKAVQVGALAQSLAVQTRAANVVIVGRKTQKVRRAFVCVGSAGTLPFEVPGDPCGPGDVIITGEISHHGALQYQRAGAAAIALGHWASERPVLKPLAKMLGDRLSGARLSISKKDHDPFVGVAD